MCGSGTTCRMAKLLRRNYIGIEISKEYAKLATDRIKNLEKNQKDLFKNNDY